MFLTIRNHKTVFTSAVCLLLCFLSGLHGFEQSSYALIQIVEEDTPAPAADDRRLTINRSVFDSKTVETAADPMPPATNETIQLDFTGSGLGDRPSSFLTGSSAFESSFGGLQDDAPNETDTLDLDLSDLQSGQ